MTCTKSIFDTEKKKKFKGFTLVEIIVVLVILAVLACAMIPALTGYIDNSKKKMAISEARNVLVAAQTLSSVRYAENNAKKEFTLEDVSEDDIFKLADIPSGKGAKINSFKTNDSGKVILFEYITTNGHTINYKNGSFSIVYDIDFDLELDTT